MTFLSKMSILSESVEKTVKIGVLAQLGEHLPYKQRVTGSSPVGPIFYAHRYRFSDLFPLYRSVQPSREGNLPYSIFTTLQLLAKLQYFLQAPHLSEYNLTFHRH